MIDTFREILKLDGLIQDSMMGLEDTFRTELNGNERYLRLNYILNQNDLEIKLTMMEEDGILVRVEWNGDRLQEWYGESDKEKEITLSEKVLSMVLSDIIDTINGGK